ncbi:hypothetical protein EON65_41870 [archaeon]|nr:MAG: hypothetical protein EON65_41870 [archaeon]
MVCKIAEAPFAGAERKQRKPGDRRMYEIEQMVKNAADGVIMTELYPRSEIVIGVHILEADG